MKDLIERLKEAAEKATTGPWATDLIDSRVAQLRVVGPSEVIVGNDGICEPDRFNDRIFAENDANMIYIALCSPDNILSLIDRLTASKAVVEKLAADAEEYYARGLGLRRRIVDYLNSQSSKNSIRNSFVEWEGATGTKFLLEPAIRTSALNTSEANHG